MIFKKLVYSVFTILFLSSCNTNQLPLKLILNSEQTFTKGSLTLSVDVTEGITSQVELLKNGQVFATLTTPFNYTWDSTKESEGTYTFQARAKTYMSKKLTLTVDRTVPTVVRNIPLESNVNVRYSDPKIIVFLNL